MADNINAADKPELSVPLSVLDRFLTLSQENHEAYGAMVTAVDSMSSKMMELTDTMYELKDTIDKEQLAKVVTDAMAGMRGDLAVLKTVRDDMKTLKQRQDALPEILREVAACNGEPQYNVLFTLAEELRFQQTDKKDVQALGAALGGLLGVIAFFQRRKLLFVFLGGVMVVALLGTAGEGAKSVIKLIMGLL